MSEQASADTSTGNAVVVETFLNALQDQDFVAIEGLIADDLVWQNVGFPSIRGGTRILKLLRGMEGKTGFEVAFHRNVAEGGTVLNERTDAIVFGPLRVQFWVCGVFEVRDGRITLWRDYFDMFDFAKGLVRGLIGVAVPALRPSM
jgi:limonene-1,2-epoxide hydrolase